MREMKGDVRPSYSENEEAMNNDKSVVKVNALKGKFQAMQTTKFS